MPIIMNQVGSISSSAASLILNIPNGPATVVLSNPTGGVPMYVGTSNTVTATNGFFIPAGSPPVTLPTYESSTGEALYAIVTGATPGKLSYAIITTH